MRKAREEIAKLGVAINKIVDILESILGELKIHRKMLMKLKISVGSLGKRDGRDLEKMVLVLYRDSMIQAGIDPEKAGKIHIHRYTDLEGN